jgi:mono/diheme cytochrome c family protein
MVFAIEGPTKSLRTLIAVMLLASVAVSLAVVAVDRFSPESSPIARGADYAAHHRCETNSCSAELAGKVNCGLLPAGTTCDDVVVYWKAMALRQRLPERLFTAPDNWLLKGEALARSKNCFRCHGELGQGGFKNAGALKGYIPGYFGDDFRLLTDDADREVVMEWIRTGKSRSLTEHVVTGTIANYFLRNQAVSMPSFYSLPRQEIELLASYVRFLNTLGALDDKRLDCYIRLTVEPGLTFVSQGKFDAMQPELYKEGERCSTY